MDHLQHIFASSRDAIGVSLRGVHVRVNPAYLALFGYEAAEDLVGRPILDLIAGGDRARIAALAVERAEGRATPTLYETRGLRRDGTEFEMEVHGSSYPLEGAIYTVVTLRDITERNRAARLLRESEEKFRLLAEQTLLGTAIMQGERLAFVNERLAELLEYSVEEMLGWAAVDFGKLLHADDRAFVTDQLRKKMSGEAAVTHYSYRVLTKSGKVRWLELYSKPISFGGAPAVLISQLDVTARHDAEAEKSLLEDALRQAQKMEAVGRLAGGVAHDFNNLLTGILGNVGLALDALPETSLVAQELSEVRNSAQRAAALTSQLLAFSRKQALSPRVLDVNTSLLGLESMLRRLISAGVHLTTRLALDLPLVKVDAAQLEQSLVNLVLNACDAVGAHGNISLSTEAVTLTEKESLAIAFARAGSFVRITVEDDGCGMSEEVQRHIFEPFFTTKPVGKGTGLGLAMVFGALAQAGGTVSVRSAPGQGAQFHLWLPVAEGAELEARSVPSPGPFGGRETVLVVEDATAVRRLVQRQLERLGYTVLACEDAERALLAANGAHIDLLVTDIIMPGMNGRELAKRLLSERPGLRVLYMSGYTGDLVDAYGAFEPGTEFLQKPFVAEEIARRVRRLLDGRAATR